MSSPAELLEAALGYAARGWPVFPCNPKNKHPLLAGDMDEGGKPIPRTGGVNKASTDEAQIRAWWKKWPKALIGLATGHPTIDAEDKRLFVLDFDPREDADTGEVWTLERLKGETETQLGCALPPSLAGLTPSDGVHLYLLQADGGPPITNRGNLPEHVDVRGLGGYVIAAPSVMGPNALKGQGGLRYRWHREAPVADAPARLLEVLRERKGKIPAEPRSTSTSATEDLRRGPLTEDEAVRKYALAGLDAELRAVRTAASGRRNAQLNESAFAVATLVAARALDATVARLSLEQAARDNPGNDDDRQLVATLESGWSAGLASPRDLSEVASAARERSERNSRSYSGPSAGSRSGGHPPARPAPRAAPPATGYSGEAFRNGSGPGSSRRAAAVQVAELTEAERTRLERIAGAWLGARLDALEDTPEAVKRLAWGIGRRLAAQLLDEAAAKEVLWERLELVDGVTNEDVDRAIEEGKARGFDPGPALLDLRCAKYPLTDFGLAERFRDRFGHEFRFTTAKGWLGWDGRRWKVLDQDEKTPPAEVIAAVFETVRAVQTESRAVRDTGTKWELVTVPGARGEKQVIADGEAPNPHAVDYWMPKGRSFIRFSEAIAIFGRASEAAGKPGAIAALSRRWLTVPIEQFDCEQMAINVQNGTLRFEVERMADGTRNVAVRLDEHNRDDLITRIAPVDYDRAAKCDLYDGMIRWAQPDPATHRYVHQVGGYAITGHTGEHKLWFHYGRGRNGKSTSIDAWCSSLGDYSGTIGIESFLDQGIKKRGDAATPDLAKLGGVRMLRASEPERGAKLNSALIKAATGGEPMSVRSLHRGFFDLNPRFKLHMSGNSKPSIPDTDDGIWTRMKLVPWDRNIDKPEIDPFRDKHPEWHEPDAWPKKDTELLDKIKAGELAGVFLRLVQGLVDYLEHGFVEPDAVATATADYRDKSDPLARFLRLCSELDANSRTKSSDLHAVYAAWCKAAGEREWSPNGFSDAMIDKGFTKVRSDGMRWEGLRLIRQVGDFLDAEGRVRLIADDLSAEPPARSAEPEAPFRTTDDDEPSF
jgi:putative DNA primase/helicase